MDREVLFAETLKKVRETAVGQGGFITKEQLSEGFLELALSAEQMELVKDYLTKRNIRIGEAESEKEAKDAFETGVLTGDEAGYLEEYMKSLSFPEEVSEEEKEAVTLSAMAGDRQAGERLATLYLKDVVEIAKLYAGQGVFLEDLIGEGNLALTTGVGMLGCLENAAQAQGMLGKMIMDAMEDLIADNMQEARKGRKVLQNVNSVADRAKELSETLHRKVTVEELMEETGFTEEAIREAVRMSGNSIEHIESGR